MILAALALAIVTIHLAASNPRPSTSNLQRVLAEVGPSLRHGDLVLVTDPELKSVTYKSLPNGVDYATPLGLPVGGHDAQTGLVGAYSRDRLKKLLAILAPGQHVLLIRPLIEGTWRSRQTMLARRLAAQLGALLAEDPKLRPVTSAPRTAENPCCASDSALLYIKM